MLNPVQNVLTAEEDAKSAIDAAKTSLLGQRTMLNSQLNILANNHSLASKRLSKADFE